MRDALGLLLRLPDALRVFLLVLRNDVIVHAVEDEEEDEDMDDGAQAAYITTGLITAGRALAQAHAKGEKCKRHHQDLGLMLSAIDDSDTAFAVIGNLVEILGPRMDEEEVTQMVSHILAHELGEHDEDDDD